MKSPMNDTYASFPGKSTKIWHEKRKFSLQKVNRRSMEFRAEQFLPGARRNTWYFFCYQTILLALHQLNRVMKIHKMFPLVMY